MPTDTTTFRYPKVAATQRLGQLGDEHVIGQTLLVERKDGAAIDPITMTELMIDEGVIPVVNEVYSTSSITGFSWQQFARFRGYEMEPIEARKLRVNLRWSTLYTPNPTSTTTLTYSLPSSTEYNTVVRSASLYRTSWTTNPPASSNATASDIGGTSVGGFTFGQTMEVPQTRIRMRFTLDASATSMLSNATKLSSYIGTMNNASFAGCAAYTLICEGVNVVKTFGEYYEVVFDFLYDPWYHHSQVATVAADGRPDRNGADLAEVKWKRLPRTLTDFNNIYGGDVPLKTMTEKGWWS